MLSDYFSAISSMIADAAFGDYTQYFGTREQVSGAIKMRRHFYARLRDYDYSISRLYATR